MIRCVPLVRPKKPMKRSRIERKRRRNDKQHVRTKWAKWQPRCAACPAIHGLETHHILNGRYGRIDDPRNFLRLCRSCHERFGRSELLDICLWLKLKSDPLHYDREWLGKIYRGNGSRLLPKARKPE